MKIHSQHAKGVSALVLLSFGFAVIAIAARYLSFDFTLLQQLYLSFGAAFLCSIALFGFPLSYEKLRRVPRRDWMIILFRAVIGYLVGACFYRESLVLAKIANVTFIQSLPVGAIFGWLLFREKFTWVKLLLLFVAFIGVLLIVVKDSFGFSFGIGELFSLVSTILFALSYVSVRWQSNLLNDRELAQLILFIGTSITFLVSVALGEKLPTIPLQFVLLLALFMTGFFNAVNIFLINYGYKHVKIVLASNILTLEAVFALILAFIFYQELPNLKELIGGILIIISVILMNYHTHKEEDIVSKAVSFLEKEVEEGEQLLEKVKV